VVRRRPFLLVYIHSAPEHYVHRLLLRQTWARPSLYDRDIRVVFFVGRRSTDSVLQQAVRLEAAQFRDIVQAGVFDSKLSFKSYLLDNLRAGIVFGGICLRVCESVKKSLSSL